MLTVNTSCPINIAESTTRHPIFNDDDGCLSFLIWGENSQKASFAELENLPHDEGTIWEALENGDIIELKEGLFEIIEEDEI